MYDIFFIFLLCIYFYWQCQGLNTDFTHPRPGHAFATEPHSLSPLLNISFPKLFTVYLMALAEVVRETEGP